MEVQPSHSRLGAQGTRKQISKQPKRRKGRLPGVSPLAKEARLAQRQALEDIAASPISQQEDPDELGKDIGSASSNTTAIFGPLGSLEL
ncbi:hypothetical protein NDU88_006720 [Pleurodeles waltl]|uniref:Uncharacterized protein n=1 Tax=Pleurodeles waltl TaxID=8319 RepID=A0AAV7PJJ7_PLEWA|nr:hypothetical protein NDU88_006720 [Pleurodeles waltl]